jgi:hypothetical protein
VGGVVGGVAGGTGVTGVGPGVVPPTGAAPPGCTSKHSTAEAQRPTAQQKQNTFSQGWQQHLQVKARQVLQQCTVSEEHIHVKALLRCLGCTVIVVG